MTSLPTILERLEAAQGADNDLDIEIAKHFGLSVRDDGWIEAENPMEPDYPGLLPAPMFTASIDAALALVERELPEWQCIYLASEWQGLSTSKRDEEFRCTLGRGVHSYVVAEGKGASLPLAILTALIKAKISEGETV